jgi:large subunit ribosomal protein L30
LLSSAGYQFLKCTTANKQTMGQIAITQIRSRIGHTKRQKDTLDSLGLRKINATVVHEANECILGMVRKVQHLVVVKEV